MRQLKTHIDGCNARVAEATADQTTKLGGLETDLRALYAVVQEAVHSLNRKVEVIEAGGSLKREKKVYLVKLKDMCPETFVSFRLSQMFTAGEK